MLDTVALVHTGEVNRFSYHCSEKPGGGNWRVAPDEKDIGTNTSVGPIRKITSTMLNAESTTLEAGVMFRRLHLAHRQC